MTVRDQPYDVIVAGLGAMGSASAYALTRSQTRSHRVLGIDRFTPPHTLGSFDTTSGGSSYGSASPFDQLEQKGEHEVLHSLVAQLPEREREIVQLRYFDGIPSKDVAQQLGLSEARISQLHARAMGRLRAMVAEAGCDVELAA